MMEDGTLAAIFFLWALTGIDLDDPLAKQPADPGYSFGIGRTIVDRRARGYELRYEYRHDYQISGLQPILDVSATNLGGLYLGAGFRKTLSLPSPLYVAASNTAGLWAGNDVDLGSLVEFRTTVEIGAELGTGQLALAWDHRSNAWLSRVNPGMEVLSVRYGWRF